MIRSRILIHLCKDTKLIRSKLQCSTSSAISEVDRYYKTSESNPLNHNLSHLGRLYEITDDDYHQLANVVGGKPTHKWIAGNYAQRMSALQDRSLMARRPYLEVLQYLKQADWHNNTNLRFVLWGKLGTGKSVTLCQITHFALKSNYILLNFRDLKPLLSVYKEAVESEYKPGRWNFPQEAMQYLNEISFYNRDKMEGLVTHKSYKWSEVESTPEGAPLTEVLDMGLNRPRFSADCLNVILKELKLNIQSGWNKHPVMLVIDGINALFQERTFVSKRLPRRLNHKHITTHFLRTEACTPDELSLLVALKHLLKDDYKNACVVSSVDKTLSLKMEGRPTGELKNRWRAQAMNMVPDQKSDYPFALLDNHGWQKMHPFIPIETSNYSEGELDAMIDHFVDKNFIRKAARTDMGRKEIHFLTARNPGDFHSYSSFF